MLEPLGILSGPGALDAVKADAARPLAGGPLAFCLVRDAAGTVSPAGAVPADHALSRPPHAWAGLPPGPAVMGIVNVTPDSFSGGGALPSAQQAIELGRAMLGEGATILDVGGESTRPGAEPVPADEEQRRVLPVVAALAREGALISVDTRNASTMARALDAGAAIVNDVSALAHDPGAPALVAARRCPVILMHMRGTPQTMAGLANYSDVGREVVGELAARIEAALAAGIDRTRIAVDPGFGFAKNATQSRELLQRLPLFINLSCPIIAGMSRKRFIGEMAGRGPAQDRDVASAAAGVMALSLGASILRVHNVAATMDAVRVWQALNAAPEAKEESRA